MTKVKKIDIKEFREFGYLQELNRQFLHPLGLALEIKIDEQGQESLSSIWDYRQDPEGLFYAAADRPKELRIQFLEKAKRIEKEKLKKQLQRTEQLGFFIEPLPNEED